MKLRDFINTLRRMWGRPYVILRRDEKIVWTREDAAWLAGVLDSPAWKKLYGILQDRVANSTLPSPKRRIDPDYVEAFVLGMLDVLAEIYRRAPVETETPVGNQEPTTMQEIDEE